MADLTLTLTERLLLANQLRILQHLNPDEDYSLHLEIVENGYEHLYDELTNGLFDPPAPGVGPEVYDIFEMFRSLSHSIDSLSDKSGVDIDRARFRGYDGNHESQHYAFARFLIEKRGHYGESKPAKGNYNTHWPVLPVYRRMLAAWRSLGKRSELLTQDEIVRIIAAGQEQT